MKKYKNNKSGFILINIMVGIAILSITIIVIFNFTSYLSNRINMVEKDFDFYVELNNLIEEIYSLDWGNEPMENWAEYANLPEDIVLGNNEIISINYIGTNITEYNTLELIIEINILNKNISSKYYLEKAIL